MCHRLNGVKVDREQIRLSVFLKSGYAWRSLLSSARDGVALHEKARLILRHQAQNDTAFRDKATTVVRQMRSRRRDTAPPDGRAISAVVEVTQ